ncbi:MAG: Ig-like domain-containing protein, partial [Clostridia bacterium]|nr:Ig-like domain-containing protein [Clostridia bacterium]
LLWSSSNENVAIVDQLGNITAVADNGTAEITCVSNDGGFTKTMQVTATKVRLTGASASDPTPEVEHYGEVTLVPLLDPIDADVNIAWSVSNPAILAVDGNGTLSGLEVGTTNVYASITDYFDNEITITYSVTVTPIRVTGIELSGTYSRMRTGGQDVIEYTITPSNADDRNIIINVTPAGIVTAEKTQDGVVTLSALQTGSATVRIITVDQGFEGTIDVQVFDSLTVSATPNLEKTTVNNTVAWELDVGNTIGQLAYQISVTRDGSQLLSQTSYDPAAGISLPANVAGDYQLSVTVTDVDGQTAQTVSTVTVSDTITYTENGNVWVYVVTEVQGQLGASVKLDTLASGVTAVTIPKTMYGAPVVRIDTEAFMGQTTIVSVATPNTVTEIGARAFKGCTGLTSMSTY